MVDQADAATEGPPGALEKGREASVGAEAPMAEVLMPLMPFSASRLSRALCTSITARGSLTGAGVSRAMRPIRESVPIGWSGVTLEGGAASIWAAEMLLGSARGARAQANGLLSTSRVRVVIRMDMEGFQASFYSIGRWRSGMQPGRMGDFSEHGKG
ncbi:hypothetical protein DNJ95_05875, partial [Stutzerimonas kirkiae]